MRIHNRVVAYLPQGLAPAMVLEAFPLEEAALVLLHHRLLLLGRVELLGGNLLRPGHISIQYLPISWET